MNTLLINIDVPDLKTGVEFYTQAFGLKVGRRLGNNIVELLGLPSPIYLLEKKEGSLPSPNAIAPRSYKRHWTPVHMDIVVDSIEVAVEKSKAAGGILENGINTHEWGKIAMFSDPFGNGFCVIEFIGSGYDLITNPPPQRR